VIIRKTIVFQPTNLPTDRRLGKFLNAFLRIFFAYWQIV